MDDGKPCSPDSRRNGGSEQEIAMKSLKGQLLIAMPQMLDPRFARSVVYVCAHSGDERAMGLVINKLFEAVTTEELCAHLKLGPGAAARSNRVHFGGPL